MKIEEMLDALGLTPEAIDQIAADIAPYNFQHPEKPMAVISLDDDVDTVRMSQTPIIGRAIAKERGRLFLDEEKKFPMTFDTYAMRYGSLKIAKFYGAGHLFE